MQKELLLYNIVYLGMQFLVRAPRPPRVRLGLKLGFTGGRHFWFTYPLSVILLLLQVRSQTSYGVTVECTNILPFINVSVSCPPRV